MYSPVLNAILQLSHFLVLPCIPVLQCISVCLCCNVNVVVVVGYVICSLVCVCAVWEPVTGFIEQYPSGLVYLIYCLP